MPRLPTILVIGSQDMSTTVPASGVTRSRTAIAGSSLVPPPGLVARGELVAVVPPGRLLADRAVREAAEPADHRPVGARHRGRHRTAGRLVHERHELVG